MNKQLRFSRRMGDSYPFGAEYGCAVTRYERRVPLHEKVLYVVGAVGFVAALVFNNFGV